MFRIRLLVAPVEVFKQLHTQMIIKPINVLILVLVLAIPQVCAAQSTSRANRAWKPFFASFRSAVKNRNKAALTKMMSRDFYYLSSGGDENDNNDTRDEAFQYWETANVGSWQTLEDILDKGTAPNTVLREPGNLHPSKIAPPLANNRRAIESRSFDWYAVFEYRAGRWYWVAFTECCE